MCCCRMLQDLDGWKAAWEQFVPSDRIGTGYDLMPTTSVLSFKSAAQAGLQRRRLLVLAVLSAQSGPDVPAGVLQHICKLAELVL